MEFPNTGIRCSVDDCKQLDFLPFDCKFCKNIFCKHHFNAVMHKCSKIVDNVVENAEKTSVFHCSQIQCTEKSAVEMPCVKCKKHFCLNHRFHECFQQSQEEKQSEQERWNKPKQEFLATKEAIDLEVRSKLKKSKNSAMANKVQLMKLKGKSVGPNNVPAIDRRYFLVHPPMNNEIKIFDGPKGAFVCVDWSIGKVIDSLSDSLNIPNFNNQANGKKLRLFQYQNGNIVTEQMDTILSDLIKNENIIDGQDIILEYSTDEKVDCSLYK